MIIFFKKVCKKLLPCKNRNPRKQYTLIPAKAGIPISQLIFVLCVFMYLPFSIATVGSITDPSYSTDKPLEKSLLGPIKASVKVKLTRNLRRGLWKDFLDTNTTNNIFDSLLLRTDLSFTYPLSQKFSVFKQSPHFRNISLFATLPWVRPVYDTSEPIKKYCWGLYFCLGEISLGLSDSLPEKYQIKSNYSVYISLPNTKNAFDKRKILGLGTNFTATYPLLSVKRKGKQRQGDSRFQGGNGIVHKNDMAHENNIARPGDSKMEGLQIQALFSNYFDTGIYGSLHADSYGTYYNNIFYTLNQLGLKLSVPQYVFLPLVFLYFSHHLAMDYDGDFFQKMSISGSAVWSINKRLIFVMGLNWGGDIFQHEFSNKALDVDPFNADETIINGGLSYSF